MNSKKTAQYVMLAEASYADLTKNDGTPITRHDEYFNALKADVSRFAKNENDGQIDTLRDNWDVVANWKDRTDETSFSATLFQNKNNDGEAKYVLAFKGSKEAKDFLVADGGDDLIDSDCQLLLGFDWQVDKDKQGEVLRQAA